MNVSEAERKGLFLEAHGGNVGQGADYVTGSGSNGSVNGGNGGTVMFCYVSNSSAQLGELMKALTAKSPSFRARAQKLGVMVLKDTADIASAQATAVTTQTAGFETNCQTLAGLIPTFDLIKSRFGPIMPKATQTALKATVEAVKVALTLTVSHGTTSRLTRMPWQP